MNEQVAEHLDTLLSDRDYEEMLLMREAFSEVEAVHAMILDQINAGADRLWKKDQYSTLEFYKELMDEKIYLDAMDKNITKWICEMIDYQSYWEALNYCELIAHSDKCLADVQAALIADAKKCMENYEYWAVDNLYYTMLDFDQDMEPLKKAIYEHACALLEQGDYEVAELYFELLGDYEDCAEKLEEIAFMEVVETLEDYIEYGWYYDAKWLVNSYSGEWYERLLEIYLSYCGDETFLTDLETALLERAAAVENGASYQELIDIENAYLSKYWNMPFYDEDLQDLVFNYLYALDDQEDDVYNYEKDYYDYYEFIYYFALSSASRYDVLDQLNTYCGFGSGNAQLEVLLGTGDNLRQWAYAWYDIHGLLSYYLWGWGPYEEDGVYYLDVYNYTEYTFSFAVYEQFYGEGDTLLTDYYEEYVSLESGETCRVVIAYPEDDVNYWYIDWDIYEIYYEGVLLGTTFAY